MAVFETQDGNHFLFRPVQSGQEKAFMNGATVFHPGPRLSECLAESFTDTSLLRVRVERYDSAVLLCFGGEIDASNIDTWRCLLDETEAATPTPGPLLVDVRHLDFIAVSAFAALAQKAALCARRGIGVRLISTQRIVARTLAASGWHTQLPVYPDVHTAQEDSTQNPLSTVSSRNTSVDAPMRQPAPVDAAC